MLNQGGEGVWEKKKEKKEKKGTLKGKRPPFSSFSFYLYKRKKGRKTGINKGGINTDGK